MGDVELRVGTLVTQAREGLSGGQADELDGYLGINLLKFGLHPLAPRNLRRAQEVERPREPWLSGGRARGRQTGGDGSEGNGDQRSTS